jgi:hypothetical protein
MDIPEGEAPAARGRAADEHISYDATPDSMVRVYEYGVRIDPDSAQAANEQIHQARHLYNEIIAAMRAIYAEMNDWTLKQAGLVALELDAKVRELNEQFNEARAHNDEDRLRQVADLRRTTSKELSALLAETRKTHASTLRQRFYSRIGLNSVCETYQLRCDAVKAGLGWATANDVLARALVAWKSSMRLGRPPHFARGDDKLQDALTIQFTAAGGVDVARLIGSEHAEFRIDPPNQGAGRRCYGTFSFRLGAAKARTSASGTIQMHRPLPDAAVSLVRLVRKRVANRARWSVQIVLKLKSPAKTVPAPVGELAAVHFGWASHVEGRRVAGIADAADPGIARLIALPADIETDLQRASQVQALRDKLRDEAAPALKALLDDVAASDDGSLRAELEALKRLPTAFISAKWFYRVQSLAHRSGLCVAWLDFWVARDRKHWQEAVGVARRARNRRRQFYREIALDLARRYTAIVIEPLDLQRAAKKIDEATGKRGEFNRKARSGRTVAAIYEFESEVRKAALDHGRALFELTGELTVGRCAHCASEKVDASADDAQVLTCAACGAVSERKRSGAAVAWQFVRVGLEKRVMDCHQAAKDAAKSMEHGALARKRRMAEGRTVAQRERQAKEDAATAPRATQQLSALEV